MVDTSCACIACACKVPVALYACMLIAHEKRACANRVLLLDVYTSIKYYVHFYVCAVVGALIEISTAMHIIPGTRVGKMSII